MKLIAGASRTEKTLNGHLVTIEAGKSYKVDYVDQGFCELECSQFGLENDIIHIKPALHGDRYVCATSAAALWGV